MSFIKELKRRNVFRVGIAYVVGGWLLLQLTEVLSELLKLPEEFGPIVVAIVAIGLPIALFFAWAFELTPEGVKRESDVNRDHSITPQTGKKLNNTILVMLAMAVAYLLFDKFTATNVTPAPTGDMAQDSTQQQELASAATEISRQSIAVLPFDNRSRNVDDEYFTEGIHDDLLTNLARIAALKVISRTSVMQYKDTEKTIPVIARELGVATVMEGAVQRSGNTVRINVQLIDAHTDEHLWAEIFDRELTAENLFVIQSEISEKIADALKATLSPEEETRINQFPTQSLEAYNAYLRGRQLLPKRNSKEMALAMEAFEMAVEIDPGFALAWVGIAEAAGLLSAHGTLNQDEATRIAESAVTQALEINPTLGEAYASKANVHARLNQREEAESAYKRAIELSPNYAPAYKWYANRLQGTNNRLQEALDLLNKAAQLDPLSPIIRSNKASLFVQMGRFTEAEAEFKQLLAANPEFVQGMASMSFGLYSRSQGRLDEAIMLSQRGHKTDPGNVGALINEYFNQLSLDDDRSAQTVYQQVEDLDATSSWLPIAKGWQNFKNGRFAGAREQAGFLQKNFADPDSQWESGLLFAAVENDDQAREIFLRVDPRYLDREQWSDILNGGAEDVCFVGLTLMRTGDEMLGRELLSYAANYWEQTAPLYMQHADRWPSFVCHAYLGDIEKSLLALETALDHKHALWFWVFIANDPRLRLLQEDPRFQAMDQRARAELTLQRENLVKMQEEAGT